MFQGKKIGTRPLWQRVIWLIAAGAGLFLAAAGRGGSTPTAKVPVAAARPQASSAVPYSIERGQRAVGLNFDAGNPVAEAVRAGDRIDVTGAFAAGPDGQPLAATVLTHVLIAESVRRGANIALTMILDPADAERLAFSAANARLSLSLCPDGPDTSRPAKGVTFDDL
jgi:hypothetical protein